MFDWIHILGVFYRLRVASLALLSFSVHFAPALTRRWCGELFFRLCCALSWARGMSWMVCVAVAGPRCVGLPNAAAASGKLRILIVTRVRLVFRDRYGGSNAQARLIYILLLLALVSHHTCLRYPLWLL